MCKKDKELYINIYNVLSPNNCDFVSRISGFYNGPENNEIHVVLKDGTKKVITINNIKKEEGE